MKYGRNWESFGEFKGIDLFDSFVLNWSYKPTALELGLEVSIWPESQYYNKPKPDEFTCYRKAILRFENIGSISGLLEMENVKPSIDPDGSKDYGNIEHLFQDETGFDLHGDFGEVRISGGKLLFLVQ